MRKRAKYKSELPRRMYSYFSGYGEAVGAPSFTKFARSIGVTTEELALFRKHREFDAAWRECSEIRKDYLIDMALSKRCDASFAKFIFALEFPADSGMSDGEMNITLEVLGDTHEN